MRVSVVEAVHPLAGVLKPGRFGAEGGAPVLLEAPARDVVQLLARPARTQSVAEALGGLPGPGQSRATAHGTALWLQPRAWAITAPRGPEGALAARIAGLAGDGAAVIDQSHGRTTMAITDGIGGAAARQVLAQGIRLDLHPMAFAVGAVAVTELAHLHVLVHRPAEARYELLCMATFARELWHWLAEAAAETGCEVR